MMRDLLRAVRSTPAAPDFTEWLAIAVLSMLLTVLGACVYTDWPRIVAAVRGLTQ